MQFAHSDAARPADHAELSLTPFFMTPFFNSPFLRWHILSPAYDLDKFHAPLLLQMPEQEYLYSLDYAIPLLLDHRADMYVFPNKPHQKFQPKHKLAAYERNLDWFRF
ncbi:MAG: hypothetical protein EPN69_12345 [Rhodanobacter sp.]|nr:MAG: hypothetical protein EPN69_12345 [Rhodanobacter sp.]TAM38535.1 MAG: hypothetical protein EPN58_16640 [Rhodanobacter sp.]